MYILTDDRNKRFYTGLTDKLARRNAEHKYGLYEGFTRKYGIHKLVYYEIHKNYETAAHREQLIKRWKREYKINVIERMNPYWDDLFWQPVPDPATSAGL
ncbi:MAG: GIY-YIG nuclease family protein [Pseudomonadota bacterium]|nr:GIY-YIG nuclease family protein [Pseudomonadota bacterium]MDE3038233.1 GIY-YIG nuclease family protein [Pseudomonadota bacterium]